MALESRSADVSTVVDAFDEAAQTGEIALYQRGLLLGNQRAAYLRRPSIGSI